MSEQVQVTQETQVGFTPEQELRATNLAHTALNAAEVVGRNEEEVAEKRAYDEHQRAFGVPQPEGPLSMTFDALDAVHRAKDRRALSKAKRAGAEDYKRHAQAYQEQAVIDATKDGVALKGWQK